MSNKTNDFFWDYELGNPGTLGGEVRQEHEATRRRDARERERKQQRDLQAAAARRQKEAARRTQKAAAQLASNKAKMAHKASSSSAAVSDNKSEANPMATFVGVCFLLYLLSQVF